VKIALNGDPRGAIDFGVDVARKAIGALFPREQRAE